ncbi:uncharacterized protein E0L32_012273 [Thyridium curvatum]|uniref:Amidase domain-containing protein n=1 Tax=Thyridium curvatum TaxID=1093900 RepID=A0A507B2B5_9PEZI|nr:uncharacterized protein E0L32_012273 [Thyridium curvatum]TPX17265.1 hypothetical protein E0L32_012273 [Thyridium curvatum]
MHELALEGLTASSLGGQTLNPYDLARTPGGSSGGSAAALAASFAVLATGGDTVNSMRSPASANAVFSFRPTRGLVSRAGTVPVSRTQDALGAMARTVSDLAVALNAMASVGFDAEDDMTALAPEEVRGTDYTSGLRGGDASSLRLGLLTGFLNYTASEETTPVNDVIADMVRLLRSAGATVVHITDEIYDPTAIAKLDIQTYEYREQLDKYLSNANNNNNNNNNNLAASGRRAPSSFEELYYPFPDTNTDTDTDTDTSSRQFLVIPSQYAHISNAAARSTSDEAYSELRQEIRHLTDALHATLDTHGLDALIYPQQRNLVVRVGSPSQSGRNGLMAALTGSPSVLVPAGFSPPTEDAPAGVPVGMELLGPPWSEARLLQIAHLIEQMSPARRVPPFTNRTVESRSYQSVPSIQTRRDNIPDAYPLGQLGTT